MPKTKIKPTPRGGLYAAKMEVASTPKTPRKQRIRELYESAKPMLKSEMVATLLREGYAPKKDAGKLKAAVDNEASYMRNDGCNPRWVPEDARTSAR